MLANPQNLNIERLISEPKSSPFAVALVSARYVLVVPNEHESVYARFSGIPATYNTTPY